MCVASPNAAAAARGDAAQAAFDRKLPHYRNEIPDLRHQGIHLRLLVWTADGPPHPAVTRTQCAADIASSRNGQKMLATRAEIFCGDNIALLDAVERSHADCASVIHK